ncbi:hypothetical protein LC612_08745 [Nostoc sp. CHAB 5834]|nr:hypothetical protein [Nostoc sp. CHAB 5834]
MNLELRQEMLYEHPDYLAQKFPLIQLDQKFTPFQITEVLDYEEDVFKPGLETIKTSKI